jgi:hypothetical protein
MYRKMQIVVTAITSCLSEFSQHNNLVKRIFGLFLYASGAQRQVLSVLSHVGFAESYSNLTAKASLPSDSGSSKGRKSAGTLEKLSQEMRQKAREVAATGLFGQVYDNINFADKVAEQTLGRTSELRC